MKKGVSIIIINYNTFNLTIECIESIYRNEQSLLFEVIVVDNASTDADISKIKVLFPHITLIKNDRNIGFAKANNVGIQVANGEYILLLNSDTVLLNDAVSRVRSFMQLRPNVGAASAQIQFPDGRLQHNCQRFPSVFFTILELIRIQKFFGRKIGGRLLLGAFFDHKSEIVSDWIWGTFFMFRKELLNNLPGKKLPETFFMYCEDMEWCMVFKRLGFKIAFFPDAKIVHYMGQSKGDKVRLMEKNQKIFMTRYYSKFSIQVINLLNRVLIF
jgi:GT2 family glycosyltransferase